MLQKLNQQTAYEEESRDLLTQWKIIHGSWVLVDERFVVLHRRKLHSRVEISATRERNKFNREVKTSVCRAYAHSCLADKFEGVRVPETT